MYWIKIWLLTLLLVIVGISFNEAILRAANHEPSLVSDADLFCISHGKLSNLKHRDVVLLGASRMQTNFDLNVFQQHFPNRKIIQLAQSGRGTAYPVFKDIVENTDFQGTILISETEQSLTSRNQDQLEFVNHCRKEFSLDRQANRHLSTLLQSRFVFPNPQSSSFRLWGNLLGERELPEPFYTETKADRSQLSDFERAVPQALKTLHDNRISGINQSAAKAYVIPNQWLAKTLHWKLLVEKFQERGGRIIFVRMPVSQERWEIESKIFPIEKYWKPFVTNMNVDSIHFADHPELSNFNFPDTSHLDMRDKSVFTHSLLRNLQDKFKLN